MNQIVEQAHQPFPEIGTNTCFHCGESCNNRDIYLDKKVFCCVGCKIIYSILKENQLEDYYHINRMAGVSQKNKTKNIYRFLEQPETIARLIDYKDERQTKIRFYLPQIHCSACLWLLENLCRLNDGILQSRVDFLNKTVRITYAHKEVSLKQLVELLDQIGYPPVINLQNLETNKSKNISKKLYYKLGLAGFVFGNIMLLSFPEYLGMDIQQNAIFVRFFGILNLTLSIPLIFYSGWAYLRSAWQGLKQKHLNIDVPISLGILALFGRSLCEILSHTGPGYLDSLAGLIFFLLVGKWFQQNTYRKLSFDRDYKSYFPIACTIKREGQEVSLTLDQINPGDIIILRHGELIPADGVLKKGIAQIDYSFVTGESDPQTIEKGKQLYAGGRQMAGLIEVLVTKHVSNSYLTQLWNEDTFNKQVNVSNASLLADRVGRIFTTLILCIATGTLLFWIPIDWDTAINAFTSVLIIACPCAVALSIPFTFGNIVRLLSKHKIYLRNTQVIENLAAINHIVFDKTGTITAANGSKVIFKGDPLSKLEERYIHALCYQSIHPLSRKIKSSFSFEKPLKVHNFKEVKGQGIAGFIKGQEIRLGAKSYIKDQSYPQDSTTTIYLEINGTIRGSFNYCAVYRNGLPSISQHLKKWAGLSLLSGDNDKEKQKLQPYFDQLYFNKKPVDKLRFIKDLQDQQLKVAMIGDGLNDAGALSQSEVGIVITEHTSNFTPACDIIMDATHFKKLPDIFRLARQGINIVYVSYLIALIYNFVGLSYAVQGQLSPVIAAILMPMSSITIIAFGVLASSWSFYRKDISTSKH